MSGGSTGSMGGPNMSTRPPQMGGSHGMHSSAGDAAVSQGHSVGHSATRSGGYNTGAVATSSSTGYGPLGNADQVNIFQLQMNHKIFIIILYIERLQSEI